MSGLSLNDILVKNKIPQQKLFLDMIHFLKRRYAFRAALQKMCRVIYPSQSNLLKILWKSSIQWQVKIYKLNVNTVTYDTTSASYLVTRSLKQLATGKQNLTSSIVSRLNRLLCRRRSF